MSDEAPGLSIELDAPASPLQAFQPFTRQIAFPRTDSVHLLFRDTEAGRLEIRALLDDAEGQDLMERRYASRGYKLTRPADVTFGAYFEGRLVSTVGIRRDAGVLGADQNFSDELGRMRRQGLQLCEFTRLAAEPDAPSKLVLASLFHVAYLHAFHHWNANHLVIEVNPRHKAFYQRMLEFKMHGDERLHRGVGAPAVLMSLKVQDGLQQLKRLGGTLHESGRCRSLFPYFFRKNEEPQLLRRLADVYGYGLND